MGAGASAQFDALEELDREQCEAFVGTAFDLPTFNKMCDAKGKVKKADVLAMAEDDEEDAVHIAETALQDGLFHSFEDFDEDHSGGLTYEEFGEAAKHLGFHISEEHLAEQCAAIDTSGDGVIDEEEFIKYIQSKAAPTPHLPEGLDATKSGIIFDHVGTRGSQEGYSTARAILKKRPAAASDRMKSPGAKGSDWTPLHYLLIKGGGPDEDTRTDAGRAAGRAHRLVAEPLVLDSLSAYAPAAAQRCLEGARFPKGHLPLELAIAKSWSPAVVEALIKAYPAGAEALDPGDDKTAKKLDGGPAKSLKGLRYMRAIAEAMHAEDDIIVLLPKPKAKGGKIEWTSGIDVLHAEEAKAEKKALKEAKKQAKIEAKLKKEAEKRAKAEAAAAATPEPAAEPAAE